jgi:ABC-type branched-subunit amino acid transport system substrate-binding protein
MNRLRARTAAALALAAVLAGCGSSGTVQGGNDALTATTLTVYSDLPLLGPDGSQMTDIVNGEALALYDAGGRVGKFHVSLQSLDDAVSPLIDAGAHSDSLQTAYSAHLASSDLSTVAYIGDFTSAATAFSLPLNNQNEILQLSPGSPYAGFTDADPADAVGDPSVYYGNGTRTFARLVPSSVAEARAMLRYMRALGVRRLAVLSDNSFPAYDSAIAGVVARDAAQASIALVARHRGIDTPAGGRSANYAALAATLLPGHPDAVLFAGVPNRGAQTLLEALHTALPGVKLFIPSTLGTPSFVARLGSAAVATHVTSPILAISQYSSAARRILARYRRTFSLAPSPYVLYGYDAMRDILLAIARASRLPADGCGSDFRCVFLKAFFHLATIHGVLGDYTINRNGDISLDRFDGYRVGAGGHLVLAQPIS